MTAIGSASVSAAKKTISNQVAATMPASTPVVALCRRPISHAAQMIPSDAAAVAKRGRIIGSRPFG